MKRKPVFRLKCSRMKAVAGVRVIVPKLTPMLEMPMAVPRCRLNHLPTEDVTVTVPVQEEPKP